MSRREGKLRRPRRRAPMSLHLTDSTSIPQDTLRVARAAFPKGTLAMQLRDTLGCVFADPMFAKLFPRCGQPAEAPWRLALVTILQFAENLSDRQAAEAVRGRIDWKYALGLELTDPGFDYSVLCKFRARLLAGQEEGRLLEALLVHSQRQYGVELVGPIRPYVSWQAGTPDALTLPQFGVDWEQHQVTCPQGKVSSSWTPYQDPWG